jgi:medium-chain acyl-[acyl-carrier-protein] hydrolase
MATVQPWIVRSKPHASLRLFCFPYAGGGASLFRLWSKALPAEIDVCPVQLPGREGRLKENSFTRLTPLVQALDQALHPYLDIPFAFFGYSMGALISFELARHLRRNHNPCPHHLFVAAHRAPQLPKEHPDLHQLPEQAFLDALDRLGGTPTSVSQHAELMKFILPMLRADFALCETYVYSNEPPLDCPITAFGGEQDTHVSIASLSAWREQTLRQITLNILPGNHFFLQSQQSLLLQAISQELAKILDDIHPLKESNK